MSSEKPLPSTSHGNDSAGAFMYMYSVAIQPAMKSTYARPFGAYFDTMWNAMNASRFHHDEMTVAAIVPIGAAFHTHHTVARFHSTNESAAQPSILKVSRHEGEYCALMSISGTNATKSGSPPAPIQPHESSSADTRLKINLIFVESFLLKLIISQI